MYKIIVFIVLLISGFLGQAQISHDQILKVKNVFPKEIPQLVTNTDLLICGERLHYELINLTESGRTSPLSKISYVSLRNVKDSVIFNHKLKLENGLSHGTFFIPATLKTGVYRLLGYTNFSLNNLDNPIAERNIYIINAYVKSTTNYNKDNTKLNNVLSYSSDADLHVTQKSPSYGLLLKTDKPTYRKRSQISLSIENPNGKFGYGNYVLSVRRIDPVKISKRIGADESIEIEKRKDFYMPELHGEILSGRVVASENKGDVANKIVAFSIPGRNYVFKTAKTDNTGHFSISIDEPYNTRNCLIQIDEPNREQYEIIIDNNDLKLKTKDSSQEPPLDPSLKDWLQERSIQIQIENAYFTLDKELAGSGFASPFYGGLATEFMLDEYTRFSSLEETFVEVITLARIRNKAGKKVFQVFDPYSPINSGPFSSLDPLLLLDGILVQDANDILTHSANEFSSIRVFPQTYRYGPKIYLGIIDFSTKEENFALSLEGTYIQEFELISPLADKKNAFPDHSDQSYDRLPDYRTQLYWEPQIELFSNEMAHIFYASDVAGVYQITLEGFTLNGQHVAAHKRFIVE